jgi:hypothetical protein
MPVPQKPELLFSAHIIKLSSPNSDQAFSGASVHNNTKEESKAGSDSNKTSKICTSLLYMSNYTSLNLIQFIVL